MAKIKIVEYYNRPEFYRYMPSSVFEPLEHAFINSNARYSEITAEVPDSEIIRMLLEKQINEKPQQQ